MFAMLAPLFAGSVASTGIMSVAASKIALTAGGALVDTAIAKNKAKSSNAAQQAAYDKQIAYEAEMSEKNRQLAKEDASNKFTDMSAAARKAGFNPLTVLRTTGGAGFGSYGGVMANAIAPVLSKFNFAQTFAQTAAKSFYDQKINEPIDKYNKEIRDLELAQRKLDLKLTRGQIGSLAAGALKDPMQAAMAKYRADPLGWTKMLDIRGKPIEVKNMILERLKLLPGQTYGLAEDMEALAGEIGGELQGVGNLGDTFRYPVSRKVTTTTLSLSNSGVMSPKWNEPWLNTLENTVNKAVESFNSNRDFLRAR